MGTTYYSTSEGVGVLATIGAFLGMYVFVMLILSVLVIVSLWKLFTKAGKEGWKSLIPIYNLYVAFEISGMSGWMFLLMFIPFVGPMIACILLFLKLAKAFGQSTGFAIGLIFFSPIFLPVLAFGKSTYCLNGNNSSAGTIPITNTTSSDGGVVSPESNMGQPTMGGVGNNPVASTEQPVMISVSDVPVTDQPVMTGVVDSTTTSVANDNNNNPPQQ